jgi:hypothetical protein
VIWVDSFEQNGDEQVYQLNKIARPIEDEDFQYLFNEPQFLLDQITIQENGEWVCLDTFFTPLDTLETFSLFPNAGLNDSWNFTGELQAEVTEMILMDILGETDSVKTISLSDNSEIILSKAHGIVNWRNQYQLIGIEGRDLGVLVPDFDDMYAHISAGDVVCISSGRTQADGTLTGWMKESRVEIESVSRYSDSIVLSAKVYSNTIDIYWKNRIVESNNYQTDTVFYRNRYTDVYPNDTLWVEWPHTLNEGIVISKLGMHKWGGVKKTQVLIPYLFPDESSILWPCEGLYSFELCMNSYSDYLVIEPSVNYGITEYENFGFEWSGHNEIVGIIDDGDTLGSIYSVDMFVGTNQLSTNSNWLVYPNPAKEFITIKSPKEENTGQYKIYNLNGILLKEGILNNKESNITIKELPKGMYFIKLNINGELVTKKWIKN